MDFTDRLGTLIIGGLIGFVLGYMVRSLREIKEELDEVDTIVKKRDRDENGFTRVRVSMTQVMLFVLMAIIAWAAFSSQHASDESKKATTGLTKVTTTLANVTYCNQQFLAKLLTAVNERTTYSGEQAQANVDLQKAQLELFQTSFNKQRSDAQNRAAVKKYFNSLTKFVTLSAKSANKVTTNPYPTNQELATCLQTEHHQKE